MLLQTGKYILAKIAIIWSTSHWNAAGTSLDRKSVKIKCHLHQRSPWRNRLARSAVKSE